MEARAYQEPGGDGDIQSEHLSGKVRFSSQELWSASGKGILKGILEIQSDVYPCVGGLFGDDERTLVNSVFGDVV